MDLKFAIEKGIPFAERTEVQVLVLEDANGQVVAVSSNRYQLRRMKPSGA